MVTKKRDNLINTRIYTEYIKDHFQSVLNQRLLIWFRFRYADRAKRIVNHAVVNEDPNARIIRELRAEIDALKEMLLQSNQPGALTDKLNENEKLVKEMSLTWEEKLQQTEQKQEDRRQALEKMGISVQSSGIKVEKNKYFLVNLNDDPSLHELLVYYLKAELGTEILEWFNDPLIWGGLNLGLRTT